MNEIRNLPFLSWKQDTAWMESMKGNRWKNLVKKENELFEKELSKVSTKEEILAITEQIKKEKNVIYYNLKNIIVKYPLYNSYEYTIDSVTYNVSDLDISDKYIYDKYIFDKYNLFITELLRSTGPPSASEASRVT